MRELSSHHNVWNCMFACCFCFCLPFCVNAVRLYCPHRPPFSSSPPPPPPPLSLSLVVGPRSVFTIIYVCTRQFTLYTTETAFGILILCCGLYFSQFDKSFSAGVHCVFGPFSAPVSDDECPPPPGLLQLTVLRYCCQQ